MTLVTRTFAWVFAAIALVFAASRLFRVGCEVRIASTHSSSIKLSSDNEGKSRIVILYGSELPNAKKIDVLFPGIFGIDVITHSDNTGRHAATAATFGDWEFVLLWGILACGCWFLSRRSKRQLTYPSTCAVCGYDLRAHKSGQKCPECGTQIPRFVWHSAKRHD